MISTTEVCCLKILVHLRQREMEDLFFIERHIYMLRYLHTHFEMKICLKFSTNNVLVAEKE